MQLTGLTQVSGSPKQVRASLLDLILHPFLHKLLVLVDTPGHTTERSVMQAATILGWTGCSGVVYRLGRDTGDGDVYRADLAQVVDEYIGEPAKNLVRVFDTVEGSKTVLSFDEADGVFGR